MIIDLSYTYNTHENRFTKPLKVTFFAKKHILCEFFVYSEIIRNFAPENKKITIMNPTIDTYRLTSMEEPSDAVLSQLMKEAAEEAKRTNEEATTRFFEQMREDAQKISATW